MKNIVWGIIALVVLGLIIWAAGGRGDTASETGPIKIGASLPLSGEVASYGEFTKAGVDLAVKEINDAGGVDGRMIEVVYEDDRCDSSGASVFNKLVNVDRVVAIIGPVCSSAAGPGIPIAQTGKVPAIIWASAPGLTKAGDYIFRTYPSDSFQGKYAAEYAYNTLGKRKVAIIYSKTEWGQGLNDVFTKTFTDLGGAVVHSEGVSTETTDLKTVIAKATATNPDMIYYPMFPASGVAGLKQMKAAGVNLTVMGGDAFDSTEVTSVPEADGVLLTYGKLENPDSFKATVKTVTGKDANPFTAIAYDSVKILASIIDEVGTDKEEIRDELSTLDYKDGVSLPQIKFDADRDLATAQVEMRIIKNRKSEPYTP